MYCPFHYLPKTDSLKSVEIHFCMQLMTFICVFILHTKQNAMSKLFYRLSFLNGRCSSQLRSANPEAGEGGLCTLDRYPGDGCFRGSGSAAPADRRSVQPGRRYHELTISGENPGIALCKMLKLQQKVEKTEISYCIFTENVVRYYEWNHAQFTYTIT